MVEKIRELCKKQGISLTKLEQQLGFGNGVIGRWNKSKPSYDRLEKVANALGVAVSDLTGEGQKEKPAIQTDDELLDEEIIRRLCALTPEEMEKVDAFVQGLLAARKV